MKSQTRQISNLLMVGGFLCLGIIASPPHPLISAVWLLVAFGILQLISALFYRSTVRFMQIRLKSVYRDFEESSMHWKERLDFEDLRVQQLKTILRNHNIKIGESI